ncbi:MAG: LysR family transcriptional regulator [Kiloniellales bacterium]
MRLEWIEDLLAIAESESLTEAALRRNVTQPAFTRRIRSIEEQVGTTLLDRSRRPARPTAALLGRLKEFRTLAANLRRIRADLSGADGSPSPIVIVAQHALANAQVPNLAVPLRRNLPRARLNLLSSSRHEGFTMLMTRRAAIMLGYETPQLPLAAEEALIEMHHISTESLCPVISADGRSKDWRPEEGEELPYVSYPENSFFGRLQAEALDGPKTKTYRFLVSCDVALSPPALELARTGWGVAWVPRAMATRDLAANRLIDLSAYLNAPSMNIVAARLRAPQSTAEELAWQLLTNA